MTTNCADAAPGTALFGEQLIRDIRERFCHVESDPHIGPRVFLENAGGSLTLKSVIDVQALSASLPSNAGRDNAGSHAVEADIARGRETLGDFLFVDSGTLISCDSTTSHAFRIIEAVAGQAKPGSNIVCSDLDHPCFYDAAAYCCQRYGLSRRVASMDVWTGTVTRDAVMSCVDKDTAAVCIIHASNVTGGKNDVASIADAVHTVAPDAYIIADGAQHIQHGAADVTALGVDAYVFSAYKVFSSPGYAFAYLSPRLAELPHAKLAGKNTDDWDLGTRDQSAFAGFAAVVDYLCWLGGRANPDLSTQTDRRPLIKAAFKAIENHEAALGHRLLQGHDGLPGLLSHDRVTLYGDNTISNTREAVFAFDIDGMPAKQVVSYFVSRGIVVHDRTNDAYSGHTLSRLGVNSLVRVSLAHYNTIDEIDRFLEVLNTVTG